MRDKKCKIFKSFDTFGKYVFLISHDQIIAF